MRSVRPASLRPATIALTSWARSREVTSSASGVSTTTTSVRPTTAIVRSPVTTRPEASTLRTAAGEQYAGLHDFTRLVDEGRVDVLQPDLSRCGGLTVGKQIADLAMRRQIDCAPHAWLTGELRRVAGRHAAGRVVSTLEGGYDLQALRECSAAHVAALR